MKSVLLAGVAIALTAGVASAQGAPAAKVPGHRVMQSETKAEMQAAIAQHFAKVDANKDGFVTTAELAALDSARSAKFRERAEQRAKHMDPAKMFARLDANKDGKVTKAEAEAAHTARVQAKGGTPAQANATAVGGLFLRGDANKDGVVTRAEFDALTTQMKARLEHAGAPKGAPNRMLDLADVNKDGKVSLAEAQQVALQHFDQADANHDGKLTPDERKQARKQLRGHKPG